MPKSLPNQNRVDILNETCGFDIHRECASYGLRGDDCTSSSLVNAILTEFPKSTVYARSSALRRTLWSAVFFLEGFYGLPWGCGGTTDELVKTAASHVEGSRCLIREVCDGDPKKVLGLRGHHQEVCTAVALPCIHVPRTEGDGLMAAALHHKVSYAQAEEHFAVREGPRAYVGRLFCFVLS
ncbi:histidine acid phosphatase superfamily protein [Besnoitia besnoiti]|uniref:Histidine acid phosphatase superfamily protein n=1 Tax=Besnoitia besnoiti TaxID=94643 RepID=A0A2A9MEZ4_BESBE|nr:histidine acid phosphatase superfamily protein [Besnoitia besnoiti]PFH33940.1 histidine acid phosphatase superfamily protein [Besnoitia besnoiti]